MAAPLPQPASPSVVIIEDQRLVAESIAAMLRQELAARICGTYPNLDPLFARPELLAGVDVLLVDFHLEGGLPTLATLNELRKKHPSLKCIWLSGAVSDAAVKLIQDARFDGFVHKDDPSADLLEAVRAILDGKPFFSATAKRLVTAMRSDGDCFTKVLSERELAVLTLIGRGIGNEEIAALLGLSVSTAKTHRRNIMGKLGVNTSIALQVYAQQKGLTSINP